MDSHQRGQALRLVVVDTAWRRRHSSILVEYRDPLVAALRSSGATVGLVEAREHQPTRAIFRSFFDDLWDAVLKQPVDLLLVLEGQELDKNVGFQTEQVKVIHKIIGAGQPVLLLTDYQTTDPVVAQYPQSIDRLKWWERSSDDAQECALIILRKAYANKSDWQ